MAINFQEVGFTYQVESPFAVPGVHDVNFTIPKQQFTAVIGHTGSGKSTMLQLLDGLILPQSGKIEILDQMIAPETKLAATNEIRRHVGMVFQFPEAQLFEATVLEDVMFGPKNFGHSSEEAKTLALKALRLVGMPEKFDDQSPFDLSGGQMRRVAIAGVLALEPEILVLDEPTAGLDPQGQQELMALFAQLQHEYGMTIILVTHQMEFVAQYAQHVLVFEHGTVIKTGTPEEVFSNQQWLQTKQLDVPMAKAFADRLENKGIKLEHVLNLDALADQLAQKIREANKNV